MKERNIGPVTYIQLAADAPYALFWIGKACQWEKRTSSTWQNGGGRECTIGNIKPGYIFADAAGEEMQVKVFAGRGNVQVTRPNPRSTRKLGAQVLRCAQLSIKRMAHRLDATWATKQVYSYIFYHIYSFISRQSACGCGKLHVPHRTSRHMPMPHACLEPPTLPPGT